jgi:hypothetical protein
MSAEKDQGFVLDGVGPRGTGVPDKPIRVAIIGYVTPASMRLLHAKLAGVGVEIINVPDKNDLNGVEYSQEFLDELSEMGVERIEGVIALGAASLGIPELPKAKEAHYFDEQRHSRGKGKKYKDWERR